MTPDRADELATKAVLDYHNPLNTDSMESVIAAAIRTAQAEVWEAAAKIAEQHDGECNVADCIAADIRAAALRHAATQTEAPK